MVPDYPVAPLLDFTRRPLRSVHRLKADKQENRTAETEAKNLQAASQARGSGVTLSSGAQTMTALVISSETVTVGNLSPYVARPQARSRSYDAIDGGPVGTHH